VPLLTHYLAMHQGIAISARTLRRRLHEADYRWKRPRYVYAGRATHLAQKKGLWSGA
jgi:transposase